MPKQEWKAGNMLYPLPAVMVSVGDESEKNIITIAWTSTICTNPPMVGISVRKNRHSYKLIEKTKEFVINLTTTDLAFQTDYCGVKSGKDIDKFKEMNLTPAPSKKLKYAPIINECPVNIECEVFEIKELGSHDLFLANVKSVQISDEYMDENGKFQLNSSNLLVYSHGEYLSLGETIGTFGYSVKKKKKTEK